MSGSAKGGMNGGMYVLQNGGGGLIWPNSSAPLPFDGFLEGKQPSAFSTLQGATFADEFWDPQLRAQIILAEFAADAKWQEIDPRAPDDSATALSGEIATLLNHRERRAARLPEIIAQAQGLEQYWCNLLNAWQGRPYTVSLIATGIAVGTLVVMHWKRKYKRARPVQVFPGIFPAIATPSHPSYPSGHALQSHLIAGAVASIFDGEVAATMKKPLYAMAERIARNREIAGVHFNSDSIASEKILAPGVIPILLKLKSFQEVREKAAKEWGTLSVGKPPGDLEPEMTFADNVARRVVERLREQ